MHNGHNASSHPAPLGIGAGTGRRCCSTHARTAVPRAPRRCRRQLEDCRVSCAGTEPAPSPAHGTARCRFGPRHFAPAITATQRRRRRPRVLASRSADHQLTGGGSARGCSTCSSNSARRPRQLRTHQCAADAETLLHIPGKGHCPTLRDRCLLIPMVGRCIRTGVYIHCPNVLLLNGSLLV